MLPIEPGPTFQECTCRCVSGIKVLGRGILKFPTNGDPFSYPKLHTQPACRIKKHTQEQRQLSVPRKYLTHSFSSICISCSIKDSYHLWNREPYIFSHGLCERQPALQESASFFSGLWGENELLCGGSIQEERNCTKGFRESRKRDSGVQAVN